MKYITSTAVTTVINDTSPCGFSYHGCLGIVKVLDFTLENHTF